MPPRYTTQERTEIVLLYLEKGISLRQVANIFQQRHPDRLKPSHNGILKIVKRFKAHGTVAERHRTGRHQSATDAVSATNVLALYSVKPVNSLRRVERETSISYSSIRRILKKENFKPYKLTILQELKEGDFDRRLLFANWAHEQVDMDDSFGINIIFSDEAIFHLNGQVNKQNTRLWSVKNPRWMIDLHSQVFLSC